MLKCTMGIEIVINRDSIVLDKDFKYEEDLITILEQDIWKLREKDIKYIKV